MKTIGIQIKSTEAILVVLEKNEEGVISQTQDSARFDIQEPLVATQIRQFKDQINTAFDSVKPVKIGIVARNANAKGDLMPSPMSFKLEGIIQLYEKIEVQIIWKPTITAFFRKKNFDIKAKHKYQNDAFDLALYLLEK